MAGERFNPIKADKLISEERYEIINPKGIIDYLGIEEGDKVADLGAGNGFLTIPIVKKTKTFVYALDIEPQMLQLLKLRADTENVGGIQYITSDLEDVQLEDQSVDKAIIGFVLHEISNISKAINELKRVVKRDGKVLILEWEAVESEMGPPLHERIPSKKMENILKDHGLDVELVHINEAIYGLKATI